LEDGREGYLMLSRFDHNHWEWGEVDKLGKEEGGGLERRGREADLSLGDHPSIMGEERMWRAEKESSLHMNSKERLFGHEEGGDSKEEEWIPPLKWEESLGEKGLRGGEEEEKSARRRLDFVDMAEEEVEEREDAEEEEIERMGNVYGYGYENEEMGGYRGLFDDFYYGGRMYGYGYGYEEDINNSSTWLTLPPHPTHTRALAWFPLSPPAYHPHPDQLWWWERRCEQRRW